MTSTMTKNSSLVAVYKSHIEAETAVKELQKSGFDMKKLSIVELLLSRSGLLY